MSRLDRSDSLRSDNSRARVSFNKDVHVKRIGPRLGDRSKDLKEAEEVLRKARSVESIAYHNFNSLPRNNKKATLGVSGTHSLDRRGKPRSTEPVRKEPIPTRRKEPKKQLSPILETESPWGDQKGTNNINNAQLYATVRKQSHKANSNTSGSITNRMDEEPSARIRRLIVNQEGYLSPMTETTFRRHSTTSIRHIPETLPPAPIKKKKKSLPDKVKSLFGKKKKDEENKDPLKDRYVQYNGTNGYNVNSGYRDSKNENNEMKDTWLKSLDRRLRRSNSKPASKKGGGGSSSQEDNTDSSWPRIKPLREKTIRDKSYSSKPLREKPLRFFGDTEDESDYIGRSKRDDAGYSSATSAKSVVYLHSPAVVDIPGRLSRRSASREELSPRLDPRKRTTVSRSVSVLAPWRPQVTSRPLTRTKFSSGDETDNPPTRPPRKLVFTGPSIDKTRSSEIHRTTSLYSRDTHAGFYGKTRK